MRNSSSTSRCCRCSPSSSSRCRPRATTSGSRRWRRWVPAGISSRPLTPCSATAMPSTARWSPTGAITASGSTLAQRPPPSERAPYGATPSPLSSRRPWTRPPRRRSMSSSRAAAQKAARRPRPEALPSVDPEHDLAEHVPGRHALLRARGVRERELRGDRNFELRGRDSLVEARVLGGPRERVVAYDRKPRARLRLAVDAAREGHPAAGLERVDAGLERLAAGERQHRIDAAGRELTGGGADVTVSTIYRGARAVAADEGHPVLARCRREHPRTA